MDFIDLDSFLKDDDLPQPQPALPLPITSNIESLGKRFTSLNTLTKSFLNFEQEEPQPENAPVETEEGEKLAEKYASMTLGMIKKEEVVESKVDNEIRPKASNLSMRLSRVLNNSLSDNRMREIFANLEEEFPVTSDEVDNLIDPGIVGSIARKKLRGRLEGGLVESKARLLKEYLPVIDNLKSIEDNLASLNKIHSETSGRITGNYEASTKFHSQVKSLSKSKNMARIKKELLISFKKKFTLNEYEEYVLKNGDINDEFFTVLERAENIGANTSILLSVDGSQLGVKIIAHINQIVDRAGDRIVAFTNRTLGNLYSLNTKERTVTLHKCLRYLKKKLNYFNQVVVTFTETRSKQLTEELLNLVNGYAERSVSSRRSSEGSQRPIYLSKHDSVRFVGELLAYVHSTVVNESETIISIFTVDDMDSVDDQNDFKDIMRDIVERTLKSLARPLKSKIEQTVSSETKLSTIHSIFGIIDLYSFMLAKQLRQDSEILVAIRELVIFTQDKVFATISNKLATIETSNSARLEIGPDLQPPEWIMEFYADTLPLFEQDNVLNLDSQGMDKLISLLVDKPIAIFYEHISLIHTEKLDELILKGNFLDFVVSKIMSLVPLSDKVLDVGEKLESLTQDLVSFQLGALFKGCGLADFYNITCMIDPLNEEFFDVSIYQPITENKLFTKEGIHQADESVQGYLPNALILIQDSLMKLNSPSIVNNVITESALQFGQFYKYFNIITKEYLNTTMTWTDQEIKTLLGVEEKGTIDDI